MIHEYRDDDQCDGGSPPLEMPGPVARVPSLDEIYRLTEISDRRVVFRDVDWSFYEELVDSIPASSNVHVAYDGRDLEVMGKGPKHEKRNRRLNRLIEFIAEEWELDFTGLGETTWKRRQVSRGLEASKDERLSSYENTFVLSCPV